MYVVFSNHLDVGYRNPYLNQSNNFDFLSMKSIVQYAFDQWFPNAVKYAADMRSFNQTQNPMNDTSDTNKNIICTASY